MANIVELREMSDTKLNELVEDAREELFNLRFQKAFAQLDNHARIKTVRRDLAQYESVLAMRRLAIAVAVKEPAIAAALTGRTWQAVSRFDYEDSAWRVSFSETGGKQLASALVDLNKRQPHGRAERARKGQPQLVTSYELVE